METEKRVGGSVCETEIIETCINTHKVLQNLCLNCSQMWTINWEFPNVNHHIGIPASVRIFKSNVGKINDSKMCTRGTVERK